MTLGPPRDAVRSASVGSVSLPSRATGQESNMESIGERQWPWWDSVGSILIPVTKCLSKTT